ncbi:hypothetical protein [Arthrobacter sp. YD2]|uniref:hypothetical protein n=1 Tax=Arthrobacter sp. YD2 TaxID=3058046 RepID=UPI0025B54E18|nr:hypothetical protein [Arthrobacter sp. YD2]MDN3905263.1 hypothetical protein [Arthrobacter sp. YD2]
MNSVKRAAASGRAASGRAALAAVAAQGTQALASFLLLAAAARSLGLADFGILGLLYGLLVVCAAVTSGFIGDSLTVLDRHDRSIRSGLQCWTFVLSLGCALAVPLVSRTTGLIGPGTAVLLGTALWCYVIEDLLRRVLMAKLLFVRILGMDSIMLVVSVGTLALLAHYGPLSVDSFLVAIACGQLAGAITGAGSAGRGERYLVSLRSPAWRTVAAYGSWRAAQQMLRPGMLTVVRLLVIALVSLEAGGLLEMARVYTAPALLVVSGLTSYLFASFARSDESVAALLRRADRGVSLLVGLTVICGAAALAALPVAGPLATGQEPPALAVAGWLLYAVSVAAATPYGSLAAVRVGSRRVFLLRLADTTVSLGLTAAVLLVSGNYALAPLAAASGSLLGGLAIRSLLLVPLRSRETKDNRQRRQLHKYPATTPVESNTERHMGTNV